METVVTLAGLVGIAAFVSAWVHLARENKGLRTALFIVQVGLSLLLAIGGISLLLFGLESDTFEHPDIISVLLLLLSATVGLPLLRPIRQVLSKVMPFDPESVPDMVGLSVILSMAAYFGLSSFLTSEELEITSVSSLDLIGQAAALVFIAYVGVGAFINRDPTSATRRLGLGGLTVRQMWISIGAVLVAFLISGLAGYLTLEFQPELDAEIQERLGTLTENSESVPGALILALSAGIGEEVLFRGALQPRYGIGMVSVLFALVHVQYGLSFVVLGVLLVGVLFGVLRNRINTTSAILAHTIYNFLAVLLSTLPDGG